MIKPEGRMSLPASVYVENVFEGNSFDLENNYLRMTGRQIESSFYTRMHMTHTLLIIAAILCGSYHMDLIIWL